MKLLTTPRFRAYLGLAVLAAGLGGLALSGDLLVHATRFTAFYVLAGAGFALLATAATSLPLRGVIVAAVVLRLIFLPVLPSLSDDYHRYVWDGRVQLAGVNPYKYRPYEHALDRVRYSGRDLINHDELRTVYPPLTQAVFLGVAEVSRAVGLENAVTPRAEIVLFKLVFGAFDLATAAAVWFLAARRLRLQATVLYLLCPAVIVQTWESAHAEAAAVFFCVLAAALLVRRRDGWAGVALGLAAAFKVTPLALLVPALLGGRASPGRLLAGFVPAFVVPYIPYLVTGGSFGSLFQSGSAWTGGSLIFTLLARLTTPELAALARAGALRRRRPVDRRQPPRARADRGGVRLDLHPARPVPARGPRLVLAHAAGAGAGRRPVAAAAHRDGRAAGRSRCRWRPSWRVSGVSSVPWSSGVPGSGDMLAGPWGLDLFEEINWAVSRRASAQACRRCALLSPGGAVAILRR